MSKEIIVNAGTRETRVALIDSGKLVELHVERDDQVTGSVYKCKVANVLPGMDAAFVEIGLERNAFLYAGDVLPEADEELPEAKREPVRGQHIKDLCKVGQELLVQVVKAPRGTKGARVSTRISLPGRYLVLMPDAENIGVSRKVEDRAERDRLKKIAEKVKIPGFGVIVRTEAEGKSDRDIKGDMDFLLRMWRQIQEQAKTSSAPALVHQDLSLIYRTIRDVFGSGIQKMFIDSKKDYDKALDLVKLLSPRQKSRVNLYTGPEPIFEHFSIENEIDRLLKRKVWLKSGGHITIDQTEALTTIDVNTGKFIGSTSLSDTILRTNQEAAGEIARQLRLRDIGGIIIIDFIDMASARDRNSVVNALDKALKKDRTRTKISNISPLGLIEMTRKRTGATISEIVNEACPYCQGLGQILSPASVSIQAERELRRLAAEVDDEAFLVTVHPEVAAYLIGGGGQTVDEIEKNIRRAVYIRANSNIHIEKYEIIPGDLQEIERQMLPYKRQQIIECDVVRTPFNVLPRSAAWADGYMIDLVNGGKYIGKRVKARITKVGRSIAEGVVIGPVKASRQSRFGEIEP
ncbi:MAG: Rne/Rng family ribonuclease [Armatimonadota bacterium]|jgi:ribonuclease G